jgi:hypothetical protein
MHAAAAQIDHLVMCDGEMLLHLHVLTLSSGNSM